MPLRHLRVPGQPRRRAGVRQQRVDPPDRAHLVVGGRPDPAQPAAQFVHRLQFGVVVVAPAGPAPALEVAVQFPLGAELLAVDAVGVNQRTRRAQCEFRVMTEKHLTHDPLWT
jgi:hypothetical protein